MTGSSKRKKTNNKGIQPVIVMFDGVCNLCNRSVDFIIRHDRDRCFRFVSFQSVPGMQLMLQFGIQGNRETVILIGEGRVYYASEAAIKVLEILGYPWKVGAIFRIIPKCIRDRIYFWIAQNRYRWFGKRKTCRVPSPEEKMWFPDTW